MASKNFKNIRIGLWGTVFLLFLFGCATGKQVSRGDLAGHPYGEPGDRQKAPDLPMITLDGKTLRFSDLKGKIVIVDFWYYG